MKKYVLKIILSIILCCVFVTSAIILANATSALWSITNNVPLTGFIWTKSGTITATITTIITGVGSLILATNIIIDIIRDYGNNKYNSENKPDNY